MYTLRGMLLLTSSVLQVPPPNLLKVTSLLHICPPAPRDAKGFLLCGSGSFIVSEELHIIVIISTIYLRAVPGSLGKQAFLYHLCVLQDVDGRLTDLAFTSRFFFPELGIESRASHTLSTA